MPAAGGFGVGPCTVISERPSIVVAADEFTPRQLESADILERLHFVARIQIFGTVGMMSTQLTHVPTKAVELPDGRLSLDMNFEPIQFPADCEGFDVWVWSDKFPQGVRVNQTVGKYLLGMTITAKMEPMIFRKDQL